MTRRERGRRPAHRRRHLLASSFAAAGLLAAVALLTPRCLPDRPQRVSGRPGPLVVLPELAVEDGRAPVHQEAAARAGGTRGRPHPPAPRRRLAEPEPPAGQVLAVTPAPDLAPPAPARGEGRAVVNLRPPATTNPCFHLERMVRPEYPPLAEALPSTVHVKVAFFVAPPGSVTAAYTLANDGPPAFADAVLAAVLRWRYAVVPEACDAPAGFWQPLRVTFPPLLPGPRTTPPPLR